MPPTTATKGQHDNKIVQPEKTADGRKRKTRSHTMPPSDATKVTSKAVLTKGNTKDDATAPNEQEQL
eukprot:8679681-Prorocentrum_lima.AAC.1